MIELIKMTWSKLFDRFNQAVNAGGINWKILLVSVLVIALGGVFLYTNMSARGVILEISPPSEPILAGVPFELEVRLVNDSQSALKSARVALGLPKGLALFEDAHKVNVVSDVGEVNVGGGAKAVFTLIALPAEGDDAHTLSASATYTLESLSADFTKRAEKKLEVAERNVDLELQAPETASAGQEFQAAVRYKNLLGEVNKAGDPPALLLVLEGSQDLSIVASEPAAVGPDSRWILEGEKEDGQINVLGRVEHKNEDILILKARIIFEFGEEEYVLKEKETEMMLAPSPLSFDLSLDNAEGSVAPGDLLTYSLRYRNSTSADLKDVVVRAQLVGQMFDFTALRTDGSFNELSKTISWTSGKFSRLAEVKKGDEGVFSFSIRVNDKFPSGGTDSSYYSLKVKGTIESPTITQGLSTDRTAGSDTEEVQVASLVRVDARAYFRDAASGILNQGPFPPRVGQATNYSIHLEVTGYGNDLEEVVVRTRLENGVTLVNFGESGAGSVPEYNESTREIIWRPGTIAIPEGAMNSGSETVFQIEATPGASAAGQYMPLVSITTAAARDTLTGTELAATDEGLSTLLSDDSSVSIGEGKVIY